MSDPNFHQRLAVRQLTQDDVDWIIGEIREGRAANPSLNQMAAIIHKSNEQWWVRIGCTICEGYLEDKACVSTTCIMYGEPQTGQVIPTIHRNKGELLMLTVSEIAEAMEGERKSLPDDHLPHRPMVEVEIADTFIRLLDYAGAFNLDVWGALWEKLEYNRQRADHKIENRMAEGGKQW